MLWLMHIIYPNGGPSKYNPMTLILNKHSFSHTGICHALSYCSLGRPRSLLTHIHHSAIEIGYNPASWAGGIDR